MATAMEIAPLLERSCILSDSVSLSGVRIIRARTGSAEEYDAVITGPGVVNTAHGLSVYLEQKFLMHGSRSSFPELIVDTGIAGLFEESGMKIGNIAVASSEIYIHTGVSPDKSGFPDGAASSVYPNAPLPFDLIPGNSSSSYGYFEFDSSRVKSVCEILKKGFDLFPDLFIGPFLPDHFPGIFTAPFITVSAITSSAREAGVLFRAFNRPCLESMEGAAAAHVAALYEVPIVEIRSASNVVGIRDKILWDIPAACLSVSRAVEQLIDHAGALR